MGRSKKDNSKRDADTMRAILVAIREGRIPSVRDVAKETGYTAPSTYISFRSLLDQGRLVVCSSVYFPVSVASVMQQMAKLELDNEGL